MHTLKYYSFSLLTLLLTTSPAFADTSTTTPPVKTHSQLSICMKNVDTDMKAALKQAKESFNTHQTQARIKRNNDTSTGTSTTRVKRQEFKNSIIQVSQEYKDIRTAIMSEYSKKKVECFKNIK